MPKLYEYLGLIFFFYANEHLPIHVHVSLAEYESKIELVYENGELKELVISDIKGREPLPSKELKKAKDFIKAYHEKIVEKWTAFFVQNKKITCEVINQKLS